MSDTDKRSMRSMARDEWVQRVRSKYPAVKLSTVSGLADWIFWALPPGGFLSSVLRNDLVGAFSTADDGNAASMRDIAAIIYNDVPISARVTSIVTEDKSDERLAQWQTEVRAMISLEDKRRKEGA